MPESVPDGMLLVEAVRAWYGSRDPIGNPPPELRRLIEYVTTPSEPLEAGPPLPMSQKAWLTMLMLRDPRLLSRTLMTKRDAMLMYHGLMGMDDETLAWMEGQRWLLRHIYDEVSAPFAFAAPALRVRSGVVQVPGGDAARRAWEAILEASTSQPETFIRALLGKNRGRLAWLYSVLEALDEPHLRFALGDGASQLEPLARAASTASPEWVIAERPFWRPSFDLSLVLALVDLKDGGPKGSDEFWREVFRSDDLDSFRTRSGAPLTSATLIDILFAQPFAARDRWETFSIGQRIPAVAQDALEAGRVLRGARQHPALGLLLDRLAVADLALRTRLHAGAARVSSRDTTGERGEMAMWQSALALLERGALTGGLDEASLTAALNEVAALRLEQPKTELTSWLLGALVPRLATRPNAPTSAEHLVVEMMSGALTPAGRHRPQPFEWEELTYVIAAPESVARRMRQVRASQGALTLEDAQVAWAISHGRDGDVSALITRLRESPFQPAAGQHARDLEERRGNIDATRQEARRAAEFIAASVLPAFAYAPHLAVTDTPELGADIAFRHTFGTQEDGAGARRLRPWQIARGYARRSQGWNLQGSMLLLDVALANWYLRRNGEPPELAPVFDELDVAALAQVASFTRASGAASVDLPRALASLETGAERAKAASAEELDDVLRKAGVDPWRRREIRLATESSERTPDQLSLTERWRIGGAQGALSSLAALNGCACLGSAPPTIWLEGRRSAGVVGPGSVETQLRVAAFLRTKRLPDDLFGEVLAGALNDVVERTRAVRPDDFRAITAAVATLDDGRMEEHVLALVGDGTLGRPKE